MPEVCVDNLSNVISDEIRLRTGYARLKENVTNGKADNHEGIDFYRPVEKPDKSKPLWGVNQWPTIPGFKESFDDWIAKMKKLGLIVMEALVFTLPLYPPSFAYNSSLGWLSAWECVQRNGMNYETRSMIAFG